MKGCNTRKNDKRLKLINDILSEHIGIFNGDDGSESEDDSFEVRDESESEDGGSGNGKDNIDSQVENEKQEIMIKYVNESQYWLFSNKIESRDAKIYMKKRDEIKDNFRSNKFKDICNYFHPNMFQAFGIGFHMDISKIESDCLCKLIICSYAENGETLTPNNLRKKDDGYNLIKTGKYTSWKGPFMESGFARLIGVDSKKYKIKGIGELLDCTVVCIVLLYKSLEDRWDFDDLEDMAGVLTIARKIMEAYHLRKDQTGLQDFEKNKICMWLFHKPLLEIENMPAYLYSRSHVGDEVMDEADAERLVTEILETGKRLSDEYEQEEVVVMEEYENSDERPVIFSKYLAPVMAAICIFFSSLDFLAEKNIWKRKQEMKKINMKWIGAENAALTEKEKQQISQNFSMVMQYIEEMNKVSGMHSRSDFLDKYYYLYYLMLYEIGCSDNNSINDKRYKFVQYYVVEGIMKFELIKKEAAAICEALENKIKEKEIKEEEIKDIKQFLKKYKFLWELLWELSKLGGVIMRIDLAEQAIKQYFDRYEEQQDGEQDSDRCKMQQDSKQDTDGCEGQGDKERNSDRCEGQKNREQDLDRHKSQQRSEQKRNILEIKHIEHKIHHAQLTYEMEEHIFPTKLMERYKKQTITRRDLMESQNTNRQTYFEQISTYLKEQKDLSEKLVKEYSNKKNVFQSIEKKARKEVSEFPAFYKDIEIWILKCNFFNITSPDIEYVD